MVEAKKRLAGKAALITGGASGIGLAVAQVFLTEGARVFLVDVSEKNIDGARQTIRSQGFSEDMYHFHHADATEENAVAAFVEACVRQLHGLDIAILNAGIGIFRHIADMSMAEYDRIMNVNARSHFLTLKHTTAKMQALGTAGSIVFTASNASFQVFPGLGAYAMSKYAVHALMATAAQEYAKDRIRVNAVSPGFVATPMVAHMPDYEAKVLATVPGRDAQPDEVAKVFLFLASDEASMVSGSNYRVDGGMLGH